MSITDEAFPREAAAPSRLSRPRPEPSGFELAAYYDAIGLAREAAHAAWREQPPTEELEELRALLAAEAAEAAEQTFEPEPLSELLARLARDLEDEKAAAATLSEPEADADDSLEADADDSQMADTDDSQKADTAMEQEAIAETTDDAADDEIWAQIAPNEPDPADLASLEALLETTRRMELEERAAAEDARAAQARAEADARKDRAEEDRAEDDRAALADADPAARLAEAADGAGRGDASLLSAISAGRLAIVFDRGRSAALEAWADASGCAPEDVVVTGLDWYLDALAGG